MDVRLPTGCQMWWFVRNSRGEQARCGGCWAAAARRLTPPLQGYAPSTYLVMVSDSANPMGVEEAWEAGSVFSGSHFVDPLPPETHAAAAARRADEAAPIMERTVELMREAGGRLTYLSLKARLLDEFGQRAFGAAAERVKLLCAQTSPDRPAAAAVLDEGSLAAIERRHAKAAAALVARERAEAAASIEAAERRAASAELRVQQLEAELAELRGGSGRRPEPKPARQGRPLLVPPDADAGRAAPEAGEGDAGRRALVPGARRAAHAEIAATSASMRQPPAEPEPPSPAAPGSTKPMSPAAYRRLLAAGEITAAEYEHFKTLHARLPASDLRARPRQPPAAVPSPGRP